MDNISVMLIKPIGDYRCSVDAGIGGWSLLASIIIGNKACAAFLYMTLSMLGCY